MSNVQSMTGFANAQGQTPLGHVTVEIRCVNSRFLDLSLRFTDELRMVEGAARELITKRVGRGKLEVRASLKPNLDAESVHVDAAALQALSRVQDKILETLPGSAALTVADILAYPGVVNAQTPDPEAVTAAFNKILTEALDAFIASRTREGAALTQVLLNNCDKIEATTLAVAAKIPEIHAQIKAKLTERLDDALSDALSEKSTITREEIADRIRQEVTLYALKMDVEEEINRLKTHVAEVRRVLAAGGAVGRRLDFLTQELNREANTLGSKAAAIEMTDAAIALKLSIDQMREQLQNLE